MKLHYAFTALSIITLILGFACSPMQNTGDSSDLESESVFALTAASSQVTVGEAEQMVTTGGSPPYNYYVYGVGTVSSSGLYTAPSAVSAGSNTATVQVTDSASETRQYALTVIASSNLSYTLSPTSPGLSMAVTITPTAGLAPYTYSLQSGSGYLSGNVYTTSSVAETATIAFLDSTGESGTATISTGSTSNGMPIGSLSMTALGTHTPGGGGCSASTQILGQVADGGGGGVYGDQVICGGESSGSTGARVMTNFYVTANGVHSTSAPSCPSGYSNVGTVADCAGGTCYGQQSVCAAWGTYPATQMVMDVYISAENVHSLTPGCLGGYTQVSSVSDCGNGTCYGIQAVCVQY